MAAGTVIKSFSTPTGNPGGACQYNGRIMYVDTGTDTLYIIDLDGNTITTIATGHGTNAGCSYDDGRVATIDAGAGTIYCQNMAGNTLRQISTGLTGYGLTQGVSKIYGVGSAPAQTAKYLDRNGVELRSMSMPTNTFDAGSKSGKGWYIVDDTTDLIYMLDWDLNVIKTFSAPAGDPKSVGYFGKYLVVQDIGTGLTYLIDRI